MAESNINRNFYQNFEQFRNIPTTTTTYDFNWSVYDLLIFTPTYFGNILGMNVIIPKEYFSTTGDHTREIYIADQDGRRYTIFKIDNTHIGIRSSEQNSNYGINIFGIVVG